MIQSFFHTDKWWGKSIFIFLIYALYWCVFYGLPFLIPDSFFEEYRIGFIMFVFFFILVPYLSFIFRNFVNKKFNLNISILTHLFLLLLSVCIFLYFTITSALSNFSPL